jgi:hypothetical protein
MDADGFYEHSSGSPVATSTSSRLASPPVSGRPSPKTKSFPILCAQFADLDGITWQCRHCSKQFRIHNSTRARAHFTEDDTSIRLCDRVDSNTVADIKREYAAFIARRSVTRWPSDLDEPYEAPANSELICDELLKFFVTANVPFRAIDNPHLQRVFLRAGVASFQVPSRRQLAGEILDRVADRAAPDATPSFSSNKAAFGCTLASDGWSTKASINFINIMLVSSGQEAFHSCLFDGAFKKASEIAAVTSTAIDSIGPDNIVQICMDGAARHSFKHLRAKYPRIFYTWCAAHCVDLLIEDICKEPCIAATLSEVKALISLVMSHSALLHELRSRSSRVLLKHAVTRFATHYLCVERVLACQDALLAVLSCDAMSDFIANQEPDGRAKTEEILHKCGNVSWFRQIARIRDLLRPFYLLLREVDGVKIGLAGKLYYNMYVLQETLDSNDSQSLLKPFSSSTGRHVREAFKRRWAKMHNPIYSVGFLLDPEFTDVQTYGQYTCADVMDDWHDVIDVWFPGKQEGKPHPHFLFHLLT